MEIANIVWTTAISGLVQTIIGVITYKLIDRQDRKIDTLSDRIQTLEDQKIVRIEERLKDGSGEFSELHEEQKDNIKRRDFLYHQEICAERFRESLRFQDALTEKVGAIGTDVAGIKSLVMFIANQLKISLPKG